MTRREFALLLPAAAYCQFDAKDSMTSIAVAAQKTFGFHLLREIVDRTPGKNVFISPLSVFLALQMAENGAGGTTLAAMRKTLELPDQDAAKLNSSTTALIAALKSLTIANALWADKNFTLTPDFVKVCESIFGAQASTLNFADPKAADAINNWVKTNTGGKIPSIVTADMVRKAAVILTNAVYFAGTWQSEFSETETKSEPVHKTGGVTKMVPMMHQSLMRGAYRSGSNFEGALLYYKTSTIYFHAMLPTSGHTAKDVLASFTPDSGRAEFDLDLKLPRFSLDFSASLVPFLKKMGMDIAFHYPQADFKPMGSAEFYISDVIHKTRLEVDEKGTVAAAASAVMMMAGSAMPQARPKKVLVFDRPFAIVIGDSRTGAVLFAGVIEEP